ncbi:MAG: hypothetical protein CVU50_01630 [Candidatus Cloacimonetes bacterium HGW-Cloacimonetes-3]|jgi:uncharacterized protein (DUF2147 family)|nr:MAG: hypothetical protein CVU50_01630 [Candidatus Cloacimonetes bacterium HGW-Cloacimonetes-3]
MKHIIIILIAIGMLLPLCLFAQKTPDRITGVWFNGEKSSKIEIYETKNGSFAGKIIWLKEPNNEAGKPKVDHKNPEEKLQNRPLMDLVILTGLVSDGNTKYKNGKIYDPKSGKTYSAKAELTNNNTLALRGFIGVALVGRTDTWTRTTK